MGTRGPGIKEEDKTEKLLQKEKKKKERKIPRKPCYVGSM